MDYDPMAGVELRGRVVLVTRRDGGHRPVTFESRRRAERWFARVDSGLRARQDSLADPPNLATLAEELGAMARHPEATGNHLLSVLVAAISRAAVSVAALERVDHGVTVRCRRFGRLHLGGTVSDGVGHALLAAIEAGLDGEAAGRLTLIGRFPGPPLVVDVEVVSHGARLTPVPSVGLFTDLTSWGATPATGRALRDLLGRGPGLVLIAGRKDTGKSTLAKICEVESRLIAPGQGVSVIDELDDADAVLQALELATHSLVIAPLRAATAYEALQWLQATGIGRDRLNAALHGVAETTLDAVHCEHCAGQGCDLCQRCGVSGRRGHLEIVRHESTLDEQAPGRPVARERRKLTA
ncbi:MAG: hypothetical protein QF464_19495 [Myxococcota bacterium]|nr:hypothetical protein [Myxococcota bacterium]